MKITRTSKKYRDKQRLKIEALKGCNVCPCCSETKSYLQYIKEGVINKGIIAYGTYKYWYGIPNGKSSFIDNRNNYWNVDCFSCMTCGAEWESDPYIM